jgi:hypothetical protein
MWKDIINLSIRARVKSGPNLQKYDRTNRNISYDVMHCFINDIRYC